MLAAEPSAVVVIGAADTTEHLAPSGYGDFGPYGAPEVRVGFGKHSCGGPSSLPLPHLVGAWLLQRVGCATLRYGQAVASRTPMDECLALGRRLASSDSPIGLLVMGDGTARRTPKAPGYFHPEAEAFDAAIADALGRADLAQLAALDVRLADELMAGGRAAWQVLAGAAEGRDWSADLSYHDAPYGVGYFVATWT